MQEWKIVIVDKDQAVLELLKTIFEEKGYKVTTVSSSQEAVQVIESLMPHLIILEIDLPGMDGYEICKKIKADSKTRLIPVMFLTEKREMEDKIKGLRLGAIDYLTKPFQREELLARVHNVLHTCGALMQLPQKELKEEDVFSKLSSISGDEIRPLVKAQWKYGFAYPEVAQRMGFKTEGEEIEFLETLAAKGLLERTFFDLIKLCPWCGHHDVNFRNVCPECHSANVQWKGDIAAPDSKRVNAEAEDVSSADKAGSAVQGKISHYQCGNCGHEFDHPLNYGHCLQCNKEFEREKAILKEIYTYRLAKPARPKKAPAKAAPLKQALQEAEVETYDMDFFSKQLNLEIKRSQRYSEKTSILVMEFKNIEETVNRFGLRATIRFLRNILLIVRKCLRELDLIALKDDKQLFILLPETPLSMAKLLANRLRSYIDRLGYQIKLNLSLAGSPEDGKDGDKLMETATKGLDYINAHQSDDIFATA